MIVMREPDRVGRWVCERTGGVWSPVDAWAIGLERDGQLVAGVVVDGWNGASLCMHVAGEGKQWLNRGFLRFCFQYVFERMGARVVIGLVPETNYAARRFDEHLGFRLHTAIPDACPGGALLVYVMRREECRWLNI